MLRAYDAATLLRMHRDTGAVTRTPQGFVTMRWRYGVGTATRALQRASHIRLAAQG